MNEKSNPNSEDYATVFRLLDSRYEAIGDDIHGETANDLIDFLMGCDGPADMFDDEWTSSEEFFTPTVLDWRASREIRMSLQDRWAQFDEQFLKFDKIAVKRAPYADLHAMLLLAELFPPGEPGKESAFGGYGNDILSAAEHDIVFLRFDPEKINQHLKDEHIIELIRCGVHYSSEGDGLAFFV